MNSLAPDEFRHRTPDTWEAASLYAQGWPVSETQVVDGQVVFIFPDGGEALRQAVQDHRSGTASVGTLAIREAFYTMKRLVGRELRDAGHS